MPGDTRIGPPHWWKEERIAQASDDNARTAEMNAHTDKLLATMSRMQGVTAPAQWKHDVSTPTTWESSGGEQAVLDRKAASSTDYTAQWEASACVQPENLRTDSITRDLTLPHVADAKDPAELFPMGRLPPVIATMVRQRWRMRSRSTTLSPRSTYRVTT